MYKIRFKLSSISLMLTLMLFSANLIANSSSINEFQLDNDKKMSVFQKMKQINHLPIEKRITYYHQLKKDSLDYYNFENEQELNRYGYFLINEGKTNEAVEILKLLVAEFPNSSNAYDSLGEAYLKDGNDELSLLNYEKSVKLNLENNHGKDQITILKGLEILVTDWGKEFFHFPIHFAPEIPYEGVEEVVFPGRGWISPDSSDFWSYVFVWALENKKSVTPGELEANLKLYFDGLMDGVNKNKDAVINKTTVDFNLNTNTKDSVYITGELTIFDAFATNKPLKLNARIFSNYCEQTEKLILLFQFSPQEFKHPVWDKLRTVKVRESVCEE
jgi:tetratricopeptide (TPR) repeat protein